MSAEALHWALHEVRLKSAQQQVILLHLSDYADGEHKAWPAQKRIAKEIGCAYSTVRDHIARMCKEHPDLIRKEARYDDSGRQTSNYYRLNVRGEPDFADGEPVSAEQGEGVPETRQGGAGNPAGEVPGEQAGEVPDSPAPRGAGNPAGQMNQLQEPTTGPQDSEGERPPTGDAGADPAGRAPPARAPALDYGLIMRDYNGVVMECGLVSQVASLSDEDRRKVKQRFNTADFDWPTVLAALRRARGAHKWMTFRKLFRNDTTWRKLVEGDYDRVFGEDGQGGMLRGPNGRRGQPPAPPSDDYTVRGGVVELGSE